MKTIKGVTMFFLESQKSLQNLKGPRGFKRI